MPSLLLDDFNHAAPLGANWSTPISGDAGTATIASNAAIGDAAGNASAGYNVREYGPDMEVFATLAVLPTGVNFWQLWVRLNPLTVTANAQSGYFVRITPSSNVWDIRIKNFAASVSLLTATQAVSVGDKAKFSSIGSTLAAFYQAAGTLNWVQVVSVTDTTLNNIGYAGFSIGDATGSLDDFGGGTVLDLTPGSYSRRL